MKRIGKPEKWSAYQWNPLTARAGFIAISALMNVGLGTEDFRAASEVVRRHGGFWFSQRRMFIIRKGE